MADHSQLYMNWSAADLAKEWARFEQHCTFTFKSPLAAKTEIQKEVNYLMTYVGVRGRELYSTFNFAPAADGVAAESDTLAGVYRHFDSYVEPTLNYIRATVNFHLLRHFALTLTKVRK